MRVRGIRRNKPEAKSWQAERSHYRWSPSAKGRRNINKPIGVSSYRVTRELPAPIREEVPTVEDLRQVVAKLRGEMETLRRQRQDEE
jgi:hypothetical protein